MQKPLLPSCFLTWTEPPDRSGAEVLRFVSWRRSLTLKGQSFREFARTLLPLLDGRRSVDEICAEVADTFPRGEVEAAIATLAAQGVLVEGATQAAAAPERLTPQLGYFDEAAADGRRAQERLGSAQVVLFGLGGAGAEVARLLAAAGVGRLRCVDPWDVDATSAYFSPLFAEAGRGSKRAAIVADRLTAAHPDVAVTAVTAPADEIEAIAPLIDGTNLVVSCLESGELNAALKLNRAARAAGVRWLACALEGSEVVAGPGFPASGEGPCYLCYRMREVAAAADPEVRFATEKRLDRLRRDLGGRRENLASGAAIAAGLVATEALNILSGVAEPALDGRLIVTNLLSLRQEKHVVLRKPGCPVCDAAA